MAELVFKEMDEPEAESLEKPQCIGCPNRGKKCGTRGDVNSSLVIVGESPGSEELRKNMPFVGPSGKLLQESIPDELDPYVTNAMMCMPDKAKKDAKLVATAARCCHDRLIWEIQQAPRKVILALGNGALWSLTGDYKLKITQERGKVFESPLAEHGIVACVHPAFLLRGGGSLKKFQEDIAYAVALAQGGNDAKKQYIDPDFIVVESLEQLVIALADLGQYKHIAADTETTGFSSRLNRVLIVGLAGTPEVVYLLSDELLACKQSKEVIKCLKLFFENPKRQFIWHNGKFDIKFYRKLGIQARVDEDTMLLSYTLDETKGMHDLEQVAGDLIGAPDYKHVLDPYLERGKNKGKKKSQKTYADVPREILNPYTARDVSNTLQIWRIMRPRVAEDAALEKLYTRTLIPAVDLLNHIETNGFMFDMAWSEKAETPLQAAVDKAAEHLNEVAGYSINPNSPIQIARLLWDELRIPRKNRKDRSTAYEVLINLPKHQVVDALLSHREAAKALSTYIHGMRKHIEPSGRIYPTFNIHGTVTGRLSSSNPNFQNIPRDPLLRGQFRAAPGFILLDFDYSQAELRSLAQLSRDPDLLAMYAPGSTRSMHNELAEKLFGPDWTDEQKVIAKAVNFGIVYGVTAYSLAETFKIPVAEAQGWLDGWAAKYPVAWAFIEKCRATVLKRQIMVTVFGRKKRIGIVSRENLNGLQNESANFPHQSTASDLTIQAGIKAKPAIVKLGARFVNIVHDSLIVECPNQPAKIAMAIKIVTRAMEEVPPVWGLNLIPFKAEYKSGFNWGVKEK